MITYNCHWLIMEKMKNDIYCNLTAGILTNKYRNVPWVDLYRTYHFCPDLWIWLVAMATERLNLRKQYSESISSEAIKGINLKFCRHVHNISLHKSYCGCSCNFVAMATLIFHWLVIADILTKVLQKCFWFRSLPNVSFLVQTPQFDWVSWQPKG